MKELIVDEFVDSQNHSRQPLNGMIEVTRLCTLKCSHCYLGDARWTRDKDEMSTSEIKTLLDALFEQGTLWLWITGGEPLLRSDFKELWQYAFEKGFVLTLFTNATLFKNEIVELFSKYRPYKIEVSIYGATRETYESVTKIPGSYRRFLAGVEAIRTGGFNWELKTCLIKENIHEAQQMKNLAKDWGVSFASDSAIQASTGEGKTGGLAPCASRAEIREIAQVELKEEDYRKDMLRNFQQQPPPSHLLYTCGAGRDSFYITSRGILQMCSATPHRGMSLRAETTIKEGFSKGWTAFAHVRDLKASTDSPCRLCDIAFMCQSCPAYSFLENGDEQKPVEWLCKLTHQKAKILGLSHKCDKSHFCQKD